MGVLSEGLGQNAPPVVLRLFVSGTTPLSARAIVNTRRMCEDHLDGAYELHVVDITTDPAQARRDRILAAPALLKVSPAPLRRFIGDMSQMDRILSGLGVRVEGKTR